MEIGLKKWVWAIKMEQWWLILRYNYKNNNLFYFIFVIFFFIGNWISDKRNGFGEHIYSNGEKERGILSFNHIHKKKLYYEKDFGRMGKNLHRVSFLNKTEIHTKVKKIFINLLYLYL